jgi:hypothetical protein
MKIYCKKCIYINQSKRNLKYNCDHPFNKLHKRNKYLWLSDEENFEETQNDPRELNKNNDCKWFVPKTTKEI